MVTRWKMFIGGAGNSAFDATFFWIEAVAGASLFLGLVASAFFPRPPPWAAPLPVIAGFLLGTALPIYWNAAFPAFSGIEGAGRFLYGGGVSVFNASLAALCALRLRVAGVVAGAPVAASIVFWGTYLLE